MKQDKNEIRWDKLLHIQTMGRDDSNSDQYRYPYEPTPYSVLERLANTGYIRKNNTLLDYGCGKGRVDFFLSYQTRCRSIGIEYDERIYQKAVENKDKAVSGGRTSMELANAEIFAVPENADRMYFFNPFAGWRKARWQEHNPNGRSDLSAALYFRSPRSGMPL